MSETERAIRRELYLALERLGAAPELLAIVGSWGDTLPDDEILAMLRDWNAGRPHHAEAIAIVRGLIERIEIRDAGADKPLPSCCTAAWASSSASPPGEPANL